MTTYYYPKLSSRDYCWFRLGGPGLANCLFFATNAYVQSRKNNGKFIEPTWRKISIGPWIRHERDKRIYNRLFRRYGIKGLRKLLTVKSIIGGEIKTFDSLANYFGDFNHDYPLVREYLDHIISQSTIKKVPLSGLENKVAIHVRLGDYSANQRIPLKWYSGIIHGILAIKPDTQFSLFSDGSDAELKELISIKGVSREFYGNAFADMYAMSRHKLIIASDSTYSAWAAFMGQKPVVFSRRHFPSVFDGTVPEFVLGASTDLPENLRAVL